MVDNHDYERGNCQESNKHASTTYLQGSDADIVVWNPVNVRTVSFLTIYILFLLSDFVVHHSKIRW